MEHHQGRLLDHVHLLVSDLNASRRFYTAVLDALGRPLRESGADHFAADELYVSRGEPPTTRLHLAFQARDRESVHRFHAAALAAGGRDNGAPGERDYHPGTTPPSRSTPTATMSRPSTTAPRAAPPTRSSSRRSGIEGGGGDVSRPRGSAPPS